MRAPFATYTRAMIAGLMLFASRAIAVEAVQLEIHQKFEKAHASVRVDPPTRAFLSGAGIPVKPGGLRLVIELEGDAQPTDYKRDDGMIVKRWTYATVSGTIELLRGEERLSSSHFQSAGLDFKTTLHGNAYATRSAAPYQLAFELSSFVQALAEALSPIVDSAGTVRGLEAIATAPIADELKKSALCRITREADVSATDRMIVRLKMRGIAFDGDHAVEERDTRLLGAIVAIRSRKGLSSVEERTELARRYVHCLSPGTWCGYDHFAGWCGAEPVDDVGVLEAIGEPAVAELIAALGHRDQDVRTRAIDRLAALRASGAIPPLLGLLHDAKWAVRGHAATALGALGNGTVREALEGVARDDADTFVRDCAKAALVKLGGGLEVK
jgi:hypothetical protein